MIEYRPMTKDDIGAGLTLCRSAGWNQLAFDWKLFLENKPGGAIVASEEGKVTGTVATIDYDDHFSWIGMVLVDPEKKRQGIGTQLLKQALSVLHRQQTVKLDATPAGREVYLKLGFKDEYTLSRMSLHTIPTIPRTGSARMTGADLDKVFPNDKKVFGADRKSLLKALYHEYPDHAFVEYQDDSIAAYSFGRRGYLFTQVGPVVADNITHAVRVTTTALNALNGPVVIDVMDGSAFQQWLVSIGFVEQRKLIRMYQGDNRYPGEPQRQFAILGPEFG